VGDREGGGGRPDERVGMPMGDAGALWGPVNRCQRLIRTTHPPAGCLGTCWGDVTLTSLSFHFLFSFMAETGLPF